MTATRTPGGTARLTWRTHPNPAGGYVRTAVGRDGSIIVNSFLGDYSQHGGEIIQLDRMVIIPAELADVFLRGLVEDVEGRANGSDGG